MRAARRGIWRTTVLVLACAWSLPTGCVRAQPEAPDLSDEGLAGARAAMVEGLIGAGYLKTAPIIKVLRETPRHEFIPESLWAYAYRDHPLPIGHDQTISAPSIVAVMTELIKPRKTQRILEIGTGSGYQAAVLAPLCKHVYTIEIVAPLGRQARETLKRLGYKNVTVRIGDGYKGWTEHAPFDGIIVTCAPERVPEPLVAQLREGGRMVIPVGEKWDQKLYLMIKKDGDLQREAILPVLFVPMTGEIQQQ